MRCYCFTSDDGETIDVMRPTGKAPKRVTRNGKTYHRDFRAEHSTIRSGNGPWPMKSLALGVAPAQAAEAEKQSIAWGVPTHFDRKTGDAIFENRRHRDKFEKAYAKDMRDAPE